MDFFKKKDKEKREECRKIVSSSETKITTSTFYAYRETRNFSSNFQQDASLLSPSSSTQRLHIPYRSAFSSEPLTTQHKNPSLHTSPTIPFLDINRATPIYRSLPSNNRGPPIDKSPAYQSNTNVSLSVVKPSVSKKKFQVKITGVRYDNDIHSKVPVYKTNSKKRGQILVINNIIFKENEYRCGAELDDVHICELFKQLNFDVEKKRNLKVDKMESVIKTFSKKKSLKDVDICVVVVMSHGTNHGHIGKYTEIFGSDDKGLATDRILDYFTAENCSCMVNKPKIFIFQCCRGNNQNFIQSDASPIKANSKLYSDMLIAHSTLPGFVAHRDPNNGTWYIQTICEVFSEHAHEHDVETMLKIVDEKLSKFDLTTTQTSSYESRGFKRCYFHPI